MLIELSIFDVKSVKIEETRDLGGNSGLCSRLVVFHKNLQGEEIEDSKITLFHDEPLELFAPKPKDEIDA